MSIMNSTALRTKRPLIHVVMDIEPFICPLMMALSIFTLLLIIPLTDLSLTDSVRRTRQRT